LRVFRCFRSMPRQCCLCSRRDEWRPRCNPTCVRRETRKRDDS
jgi:hypothetical protein